MSRERLIALLRELPLRSDVAPERLESIADRLDFTLREASAARRHKGRRAQNHVRLAKRLAKLDAAAFAEVWAKRDDDGGMFDQHPFLSADVQELMWRFECDPQAAFRLLAGGALQGVVASERLKHTGATPIRRQGKGRPRSDDFDFVVADLARAYVDLTGESPGYWYEDRGNHRSGFGLLLDSVVSIYRLPRDIGKRLHKRVPNIRPDTD